MPRAFRFDPPEPGPDWVARPRLLQALLARWQHRVVTVVGGPGLGKTTLLAQALAENRLAPRGEDVWLGLDDEDAAGDSLARAVARALDGRRDDVATLTAADAVWRRSPTQVCLVLDDVHLLPEGSPGARWLARLIDDLPANGHVVLIGRTQPPLPLARLRSQGQVHDLDQDDLRFTGDELADFAGRREVDPAGLDGTGGWPALAELAARFGPRHAGSFLWEEVLGPLGEERRRILAVLCELGGADSELLSATLGTAVDVGEAVRDVPLVAHDAGGWHVPHALWRSAPGLGLPPDERDGVRRRAVAQLVELGRIDEAFALVKETGAWELAPRVLRAACLASDRLSSPRLERWLADIPADVRATAPGRLAVALHRAFLTPADAMEPLRQAALECQAAGDEDAELITITEIGKLAWWRQDPMAIDAQFAMRVAQLAARGHPGARALAALGMATFADLGGNDDAVLAALASVGPDRFPDPAWEAQAAWLEGMTRIDMGDPAAAARIVEQHDQPPDRLSRNVQDVVRLMALWFQGHVDTVMEEVHTSLARGLASGVGAHSYVGLGGACILFSYTGDVTAARLCLEAVEPLVPPGAVEKPTPLMAVMRASILLAEGDEEQAAAALRDAVRNYGIEQGANRRVWRQTLSMSYVLVPEARAHWDAAPLRGHLAVARELGRLVVAGRIGLGGARFAECELPETGMVRATLHHRLAAELAVNLHEAGRREGSALLDALGAVGRDAVRSLADGSSPVRRPARTLLATLPAPPRHPTYVATLGPVIVRRYPGPGPGPGPSAGPSAGAGASPGAKARAGAGRVPGRWEGRERWDEVLDSGLRRKRVRELLAYLVTHRTTTRSAVAAALWPDLDEATAGNNLAVTLSYLLRVLEPWRPTREPSYLVRMDGQNLRLVTGDHLRLDVDDFDRHVRAAREAETDGAPSLALDHHLAAVRLYGGPLFADLAEVSWLALDREHYCTRFVAAATRAGQLLLGRGDVDEAECVARRAVDVDPWAEEAHAVLVAAALARGNRSAARRRLDRCLARLGELGVDPSGGTRQLQRRLLTSSAAPPRAG